MPQKSKKLLPLTVMEKIMKNAGAERVSEDAKKALKEVLEKTAHDISLTAITFALHAGRKTVKASDIKLSYEKKNRQF